MVVSLYEKLSSRLFRARIRRVVEDCDYRWGEYKLPFSNLEENAYRSLDYAWRDSDPQPSVP